MLSLGFDAPVVLEGGVVPLTILLWGTVVVAGGVPLGRVAEGAIVDGTGR